MLTDLKALLKRESKRQCQARCEIDARQRGTRGVGIARGKLKIEQALASRAGGRKKSVRVHTADVDNTIFSDLEPLGSTTCRPDLNSAPKPSRPHPSHPIALSHPSEVARKDEARVNSFAYSCTPE